MDTTLYWFSATGNSLAVARGIAAGIEDATLAPVVCRHDGERSDVPQRVGVVFPVYCLGLPKAVAAFLETVDVSSASYVFAVATHGGMPGQALHQAARLLAARGATLAAGWSISMPSNYTPFGGPPSPEKIAAILERADDRAREIAGQVADGATGVMQDAWLPIRALARVLRPVLFPRLLRDERRFHVQSQCTSCGTCADVCPVGNIELVDGKPVWQGHCEQCFACLQWCPVEAIQLGGRTAGRRRYHHPGCTAHDVMLSKST